MSDFFSTLLSIEFDKNVTFVRLCDTFEKSELTAKLLKFVRKILNHPTSFRSRFTAHIFLKVHIDHYSKPSIADVVIRLFVSPAQNIERTQVRNDFVFSTASSSSIKCFHHGQKKIFLGGIV